MAFLMKRDWADVDVDMHQETRVSWCRYKYEAKCAHIARGNTCNYRHHDPMYMRVKCTKKDCTFGVRCRYYHDGDDDAPVSGGRKPLCCGKDSLAKNCPHSAGKCRYRHVDDHASSGTVRAPPRAPPQMTTVGLRQLLGVPAPMHYTRSYAAAAGSVPTTTMEPELTVPAVLPEVAPTAAVPETAAPSAVSETAPTVAVLEVTTAVPETAATAAVPDTATTAAVPEVTPTATVPEKTVTADAAEFTPAYTPMMFEHYPVHAMMCMHGTRHMCHTHFPHPTPCWYTHPDDVIVFDASTNTPYALFRHY